ncbi:hypothetical protein [Flavobacterium sp.]
MKPENKVFVKSGITAGFIFAILMAGFNYSDGEPFKIFKFLFHFFFFGLSMGLLARYNHLKISRKKNADNQSKSN